MRTVGKGGQTVSATRFAELTGVSRERLRTWERRYGFPVPERLDGGPRRYALTDVARVIAVRRALEAGMPIPRAILRVSGRDGGAGGHGPVGDAAFREIVEDAPVPIALLSGPVPLRVEWVNAALRGVSGAPEPGEAMAARLPAFAGCAAETAIARLFAADVSSVEVEHPAWSGAPDRRDRSAAMRVAVAPGERPLVALVGLAGAAERRVRDVLAEHELALAALGERDERHDRWLDAIARMADAFRAEPGPRAIETALDVLVRQLAAVDGTLATYLAGQLALPPSRRRVLGPRMLTVAPHEDLARALRDATPHWLAPAAAAGMGVPTGLRAAGIPVLVAGETLGLVVLLFETEMPIGHDERRLLSAVSAAMGFALLRDRLADELREAAEGAGRS
jgi:MerR family transcriptional regulator, light-induced transcriptional regulator